MISAVTFDVWETLITDPPDLSHARSVRRVRLMAEVLGQAGFSVLDSDLWMAYDHCWRECERLWDHNRDYSTEEQVEIILDTLDFTIRPKLAGDTLAEFTAAYVDPIFEFPPHKKDGLPETLEVLRNAGCRIGLICNTGRTPGWAVRQVLDDHGMLGYFEALAFSDEERIRKPASEIFQRVLSKLDVAPDRAVHVGDNLATDIGGAKDLGMKAVLIGQGIGEGGPFVPDARIGSLRELVAVLESLGGLSDSPRQSVLPN